MNNLSLSRSLSRSHSEKEVKWICQIRNKVDFKKIWNLSLFLSLSQFDVQEFGNPSLNHHHHHHNTRQEEALGRWTAEHCVVVVTVVVARKWKLSDHIKTKGIIKQIEAKKGSGSKSTIYI